MHVGTAVLWQSKKKVDSMECRIQCLEKLVFHFQKSNVSPYAVHLWAMPAGISEARIRFPVAEPHVDPFHIMNKTRVNDTKQELCIFAQFVSGTQCNFFVCASLAL